ncbi:MAG: 4-alpha-glucanotransferase [Bacteroidales bacterium]|nr:4-alpha-glucanotransferase [Bacteroidales bacterium]
MQLTFQIEYHTQWGEAVGLQFGNLTDAPLMFHTDDGRLWQVTTQMTLPDDGAPLLYRYGIWRDGQCVRREECTLPHSLTADALQGESAVQLDHWFDARRVAGVAIPVFSLRSEGSYGVGDFGDLRAMVQWAASVGMSAVQILPINDTTIEHTWRDSYPYNAISIYAFHPQYIDLRQLPALRDEVAAARFEQRRLELNALPQIDYVAMIQAKMAYLQALFEQEGEATMQSPDYQAFARRSQQWLLPYAMFSVLRDRYDTADFNRWPECSVYQAELVEALSHEADYAPQVRFYSYLQFILHQQLLRVSNYARAEGVILKGDIPIGISRTSVEAWVEPYYFNMQGSTGAPPDAFSVNGQNWGFPTYNWDYMLQDGLQWWLRRFRHMATYFSAYRIDHILGFFRIWEIPVTSVHGLLGQFSPALPMSAAEIESYGLPFQEEFMTQPFINDELLELRFGPLRRYVGAEAEGESPAYDGKDPVQYVRDTFLQHLHDDIWTMRDYFDTQQSIQLFFSGKVKPRNTEMRDALYTLISDVLFVRDHRDPTLYHPRIAAQQDYVYTRLQPWEQQAFDRLYEHYYWHRHNHFWYEQAMRRLPRLVESTQMIVCGEDLGMVPECVPWVMEQLHILSLEVQRMPKSPAEQFGHPDRYPVLSVCTTGSHDTETLRQWWTLDPVATQHYWHDLLQCEGDAPAEATPQVCERIVTDHLASPSLLCILPLQDWLAIDGQLRHPDVDAERINIPANPRHYWRYRMHLTIEQLARATHFGQHLSELIAHCGR